MTACWWLQKRGGAAWLVPTEPELVPAPGDFAGFRWAEPSPQGLQEALREVYEGCQSEIFYSRSLIATHAFFVFHFKTSICRSCFHL